MRKGAITVGILLICSMVIEVAHAGSLEDCNGDDVERRINGCTAVLRVKTLRNADRALALSRRSDGLLEQGKLDAAIDDLKEARRLQPDDPHYIERLAVSYVSRSDKRLEDSELQGSIDDLREAALLLPKQTDLTERLARLLEARGRLLQKSQDHKGAAAAFTEAIDLGRAIAGISRPELLALRADARANGGDRVGAIADYSAALTAKGADTELLLRRGRLLIEDGRIHEAIGDFDAVLSKEPKNLTALLLRANSQDTSGDKQLLEAAKEDYAAALKIDPENELAQKALKRLSNLGANSPGVHSAPSEELIRDLQTQLQRVGCYSGAVDGDWGPSSQRGLGAFAKVKGRTAAGGRPTEDILQAVANEGGPVCQGATTARSGGGTLWDHNGSVMRLQANGARRRFYYERPRSGMRAVGVGPGVLLFDGRRKGNTYSGTAYIFTRRCGKHGYSVEGFVGSDDRSVTLRGLAPRLDTQCRRLGAREDRLVFTYLAAGGVAAQSGICSQDRFLTCFSERSGPDFMAAIASCKREFCSRCEGEERTYCGMVE